MNEDYLWDKSGEPDPEIQQLEQTLGRLRYKRPVQPLPLPRLARPWYRPGLSPMLAIAATLVILVLAGGLWLGLRRTNSNNGSDSVAATAGTPIATSSPQRMSGPAPNTGPVDPTASNDAPRDDDKKPIKLSTPRSPRNIIHRAPDNRRQEMAAQQNINKMLRIRREQQTNREGELAKEQLIKALLITSDKLNAVQKKIQGNQERGPIS